MRASASHCFSLLTTKVGNPFAGPSETGDRFDQALAAALTAGMERRIYLAGRLALCRDWSAATELECQLMLRLSSRAAHEGWKLDRPGRLRNLCGLAIVETIDPSLRTLSVAPTLPQTARKGWTEISDSAWSRTWSARYSVALDTLTQWVGTAESHVKHMQRESLDVPQG